GGVDYRPVDEGAYLHEADLSKLKTIFWRHNILGFTPFLDVPTLVTAKPLNTTLIGTWYEHEVLIPDGTKFTTGLSKTDPSWQIRGRWFRDSSNEAVVGAALAAKDPDAFAIGNTIQVTHSTGANNAATLVVTGIVTTGDEEDNAIFVSLSLAQQYSGHSGQFRQLYVSALTKPADALAERDPKTLTPTEYDKWFCSPYISSIGYQIGQVPPGTDVRAIRRVANSEGRILSRVSTLLWMVTMAALVAAALAITATSAAAVLDRQTEIGLMKAIGATNTRVTVLFLIEHLALALIGGTAGFVIGTVLAWFLGASVF